MGPVIKIRAVRKILTFPNKINLPVSTQPAKGAYGHQKMINVKVAVIIPMASIGILLIVIIPPWPIDSLVTIAVAMNLVATIN